MRQAENTAVGQKPARLEDAPGRTQASHSRRRVAGRTGERPWREVDGDRRGAPEQIRPGGQGQICPLLKPGKVRLDGGRRTPMRGEHRWPKLIPEKWTGERRIGDGERQPGPSEARHKTCPMCGAKCQIQTRKGKCAICETQTMPVWRCSMCSDGIRKRRILLCEDCLGHGAPVKGDVGNGDGARALVSATPPEDAQLARPDANEADLRRCNRCAEPLVTRRARRQDHGQDCSGGCGLSFVSTQINCSWIYMCTTCQ